MRIRLVVGVWCLVFGVWMLGAAIHAYHQINSLGFYIIVFTLKNLHRISDGTDLMLRSE